MSDTQPSPAPEKQIHSADEFRNYLIQAYAIAKMIDELPLEEMVAMQNRVDAFGWALDPTLYCSNQGKMDQDRELLKALIGVTARLAKLRKETEERK